MVFDFTGRINTLNVELVWLGFNALIKAFLSTSMDTFLEQSSSLPEIGVRSFCCCYTPIFMQLSIVSLTFAAHQNTNARLALAVFYHSSHSGNH